MPRAFKQFQLYAFEEGIDDFFFLTDSDEIILMRIILNIQKSVLYKKIDMQERALTVSNILDKKSKIILRDTGEIVLKEIFSQIFEEEIDNAYIMYLKVLGAKDDNIDSDYISDIIRKLTRKNDITAYDKTSGFYLILYNTDENGIKIIFNKIYEILKSNYKIYACTARITTSFEQIELRLYEGIEKQLETNTIYKYIPEIDEEDIKSLFDSKEINQINSEISKKEFLQNLESITAPVFYRIQTNYNDKLKNTKIKYVFSEDKIKFIISGEENMSELVITYPDNIRIIADTRHYIKNIEPQVKRFIYNTNEISEEKIVFLLENMIKEYLNNSILDKLYITE